MKTESRILITGGTGLAGSWLSKKLAALQFQNVAILDKNPTAGANFFHGSVADLKFIRDVIKRVKPQYVFHFAGLNGHHTLPVFQRVNTLGTENILKSLISQGLQQTRVLIVSSSSVYGDKGKTAVREDMTVNPSNNFGISKLEKEKTGLCYFNRYRLPVIIVRSFNNFAPGEVEAMFVSKMASQIARFEQGLIKEVLTGPLHAYRDYMDTRDVVDMYYQIIQAGKAGEIYNLCSGKTIKIEQIFRYLLKNSNKQVRYKIIKPKLKKNIPIQLGDNSKVKKIIDWQLKRDLNFTLLEMLDFWRRKIEAEIKR